jgi:hypothetical protein
VKGTSDGGSCGKVDQSGFHGVWSVGYCQLRPECPSQSFRYEMSVHVTCAELEDVDRLLVSSPLC